MVLYFGFSSQPYLSPALSHPHSLNMATSSSGPSSDIPWQDLNDLLSWNPPQLLPRDLDGKEKKMQPKTRKPAFFDKHFSERLKLLHVKRFPDLVRDIAAIVDGTIADGVPCTSTLSTLSVNHLASRLDSTVVDEKEVASYYDKTTASSCISVASILAFGVPDLLRWSQSATASGYAITDGVLHFADPTLSAMYATLEKTMGKERVDLIRSLAKRRSALTTQEFKNLVAGGRNVMLAIPRLSTLPKFDWTNCDVPDCATMTNHERERRRVREVEANMGHDARTTPWTLPHSNNLMFPSVQGSSDNVVTSKGLKRKRDEDSSDESRASSLLSL